MAIEVKHQKVSAVSDSGDSTLVQPSDWNSTHDITMASGNLLGRTSSGAGDVEELSASSVRTFLNVADGADVTDVTSVTAAGALMDSELASLSGVKTLTVPDSTTISPFGATLVDDADAAAARTTLGLGDAATGTIGSTVQAYDADLAGIASATFSSNQVPISNGSSTWSGITVTTFAQSLLDDSNQATMQGTLGLVPGTDVQEWDADLDAIAALAGTSGILKKTAANTWTLDTSTYLTSYTETDPVVGAVNGIVKADGAGNISAAIAGTDYIASETYSSASDLLTAIKTVDGTGSGLDADTLDGNDASAFYLASNPSGYTSNTGTVTSVAATAGTGISIGGSPITGSGTLTITNTAPDQTVSLTEGSNVTITGTYPNFTIAATDTNTTYTAGTGLSLTGTSFSIDSTVATLTGTQTLTNKTLTSPVVNVTSDATGDIYYRNASGLFTRLPIGSTDEVLTVASGLPTWAAASGGGGSGWVELGSHTFSSAETSYAISSISTAYTEVLILATALEGASSGSDSVLRVAFSGNNGTNKITSGNSSTGVRIGDYGSSIIFAQLTEYSASNPYTAIYYNSVFSEDDGSSGDARNKQHNGNMGGALNYIEVYETNNNGFNGGTVAIYGRGV